MSNPTLDLILEEAIREASFLAPWCVVMMSATGQIVGLYDFDIQSNKAFWIRNLHKVTAFASKADARSFVKKYMRKRDVRYIPISWVDVVGG